LKKLNKRLRCLNQIKMVQLFKTQREILIKLSNFSNRKWYSTKIAKEIKRTFSHTNHQISILEEYGLLEKDKTGKIKFVRLTHKGLELARLLVKVEDILSTIESPSEGLTMEEMTILELT